MTTSHKKLDLETKLKERNKIYKEQLAQKAQKEKLIQEKTPLIEEGQKIATKLDEIMDITAYFSSKLQEKEEGISPLFNRLHKKLQSDGNSIKYALDDYSKNLSNTEKELLTEIKDMKSALDKNKAHIDEIKREINTLNKEIDQKNQLETEASKDYLKGKTKNILFNWELINGLAQLEIKKLGVIEVNFQLRQIEAYGWWVLEKINSRTLLQLGGFTIETTINSEPNASKRTLTTKVTIEVIISANGITKKSGGGSFENFKKSFGQKVSASGDTPNKSTFIPLSKDKLTVTGEVSANQEWADGRSYNWGKSQPKGSSSINRVFEYEFISNENKFKIKQLGVGSGSFSDFSIDESVDNLINGHQISILTTHLTDNHFMSEE